MNRIPRFCFFVLLTICGLPSVMAADSDIKMRSQYGSDEIELQSVLYFEDIGLEKLTFSGSDLNNKDYLITISEFVDGRSTKTDVIFDSKDDSYFRIKGNEFTFLVLSKVTSEKTVKIEFQFNGFRKRKEYVVSNDQKEFALKNFLGSKSELIIPSNANTYILTYMMPYTKADGSTQYCEVVQSDVSAEDLGKKYAIPRYFLIGIKFQ